MTVLDDYWLLYRPATTTCVEINHGSKVMGYRSSTKDVRSPFHSCCGSWQKMGKGTISDSNIDKTYSMGKTQTTLRDDSCHLIPEDLQAAVSLGSIQRLVGQQAAKNLATIDPIVDGLKHSVCPKLPPTI